MRRTRQEILELFQACQSKLGRTPGAPAFLKNAGVKNSEVLYYWPSHGALAKEAGGQPNKLKGRLDDNVVFEGYAKLCLHVGKIPSRGEFRIAERKLNTQTHSVYTREGSIRAFKEKFRAWLPTARDEFKVILGFKGWSDTQAEPALQDTGKRVSSEPHLHPFLPGCLQYLEVLARGESPPYEPTSV